MAKGKARVNYMGKEGIVQSDTGPDWGFLYRASTVRDPGWNIGDKVVLPDSRVFYYGLSGAACYPGLLSAFYKANAVDYTTVAAAQAIGDKSITIATQTFTEDELRGGQVLLNHSTASMQLRGIIGNTACSAATVTIYLDAPLTAAITTSTGVEVAYNPFSDLRSGDFEGSVSWAGVPATVVSAGSVYHWTQTWGPAWVSPQASVQASEHIRAVYGRHDGSLDVLSNVAAYTYVSDQCVGFVLGRGSTQTSPVVMLQIMP